MMLRFKDELLLISILVVLLIIIITFFESSVLRIILGLPFVLFFPGYALVSALFPKRSALDSIERVALSFGLSIAVVAGIGIILNYTPWGITLYSVLASLSACILVISAIAWVRRWRLVDEERITISFSLSLRPWRGQNCADRILSVVLMVAIIGTVGIMGYAVSTPKAQERFTEFYVLGHEGKAGEYPDEVTVGEETVVIVGIVNHEREGMSYRLEITIDGNKGGGINQIALGREEKWEKEVSFTPSEVGEKQKVELVLYTDGQPYRRLHLWLNVKEQE